MLRRASVAPSVAVLLLLAVALGACGARPAPEGGQDAGSPLPATGFLLAQVTGGGTTFPGGLVSVEARVVRAASFTDSIQLSTRSLPEGVTATVDAVAASESTGAVEVRVSTAVVPGSRAEFELVASGGGVEHSATVSLEVLDGFHLVVASAPPVQVRQGAQVNLFVEVARTGGYDGGVDVTLAADGGALALAPMSILPEWSGSEAALSAAATGPFGLMRVVLRGTGGGLVRDLPLDVEVLPARGTLDPSFGAAGSLRLPDGLEEVALDPQGRVLAYGGGRLVRLGQDGGVDPTFDAPVISLPSRRDFLPCAGRALTVHDAGVDLTLGFSESLVDPPYVRHLAAVHRFRADGRPADFGDGGVLIEALGFCGQATGPGGALVVAGYVGTSPQFLRYDGHGRDSSFGSAGAAQPAIAGPTLEDLALDEAGRLVVASSTTDGGTGTVFVQRLSAAGAVDPLFAGSGVYETYFWCTPEASPGVPARCISARLALRPTGHLVAGTFLNSTSHSTNLQFVCALDVDGAPVRPGGAECVLDPGPWGLGEGGALTGVLALPDGAALVSGSGANAWQGHLLVVQPFGTLTEFAADRPWPARGTELLGWSEGRVGVLIRGDAVGAPDFIQRFYP
jgi:hypothetical protein